MEIRGHGRRKGGSVMKKKYYFAYGSNCNLDQMAFRCPKATVVGPVTLSNYTY